MLCYKLLSEVNHLLPPFLKHSHTLKLRIMAKKEDKEPSKLNLLQKLSGYGIIALMLLIWFMDRALHIVLPHREHPQFTIWAKDTTNVKYAFSRLFIFSLPIIIFKLIV